jgi:hypothetical protein
MQPYFRWLLVVNQLERKVDVTLPSSAEFNHELILSKGGKKYGIYGNGGEICFLLYVRLPCLCCIKM